MCSEKQLASPPSLGLREIFFARFTINLSVFVCQLGKVSHCDPPPGAVVGGVFTITTPSNHIVCIQSGWSSVARTRSVLALKNHADLLSIVLRIVSERGTALPILRRAVNYVRVFF